MTMILNFHAKFNTELCWDFLLSAAASIAKARARPTARTHGKTHLEKSEIVANVDLPCESNEGG